MKRAWQISTKVLAGLFLTAMYAMPQAYTISARPGAVNYIEGSAFLDGRPISEKTLGKNQTFLNTNDTISTDVGKAEVALTPGVWVRIGDNSQLRMVSTSLTDTQVQLDRGEAMIEAAQLVKDNHIQMLDHGGSITLEKTGLYRFTADNPPTAAVIDGKAQVYYGDRKIDLGKGKETILSAALKEEKFDTKKEDDLYAWSNVRSQYDAAASYQTARNITINNYGGSWGWDYPFYGWGWGGPGWYWNSMWNNWAWLPGDGIFYSPFGWGFYGIPYLAYAPVVYVPVGTGGKVAVPVNPSKPPAIGATVHSPAEARVLSAQAARTFARRGGFQTATGARVPVGGGPIAAARASGGMRAGGFEGGHFGGFAGSGHVGGAPAAGPHR